MPSSIPKPFRRWLNCLALWVIKWQRGIPLKSGEAAFLRAAYILFFIGSLLPVVSPALMYFIWAPPLGQSMIHGYLAVRKYRPRLHGSVAFCQFLFAAGFPVSFMIGSMRSGQHFSLPFWLPIYTVLGALSPAILGVACFLGIRRSRETGGEPPAFSSGILVVIHALTNAFCVLAIAIFVLIASCGVWM